MAGSTLQRPMHASGGRTCPHGRPTLGISEDSLYHGQETHPRERRPSPGSVSVRSIGETASQAMFRQNAPVAAFEIKHQQAVAESRGLA